MADIPGLIEGGAKGTGIGEHFLGHIERCRVLLHLIDATGEDPVAAWQIVCTELAEYGAGLAEKPEILALNKSDLLDEEPMAALKDELTAASGATVFPLSAAVGDGLETVLDHMVEALDASPLTDRNIEDGQAASWSPL